MYMDYLASMWAKLAPSVDEVIRLAGTVPYPALPVAAVPLAAALLSGSLAAFALALILIWMSGSALIAAPLGQQSWVIFYAGCAASLLTTALAFHRRRLRGQVRAQNRRLDQLTGELEDLRGRYEREIMWRNASRRGNLEAEGETSTVTHQV
jgi:membrane protein implicated in regulation of membrane protease activity